MSTNWKKRRVNIKQAVVILGAIVAIVLLCRSSRGSGYIRAHFENPGGGLTPYVRLKIAATASQRGKGLMFVKNLPEDEGMLFIFPTERRQSFWMKNTYLSLDMLFIDGSRQVAGILSDVPVLNEEPRSIDIPSRYVVELPAGAARRLGVTPGSRIILDGELPPAE